MDTPAHLGGHQGIVHTDVGALDYLIERFDIRTAIDLGCGPGWMVAWMRQRGINALGVDGDPNCNPDVLVDFVYGPPARDMVADLCWSVEFLEHIKEEHLRNVWPTIELCRVVFCTHALHEDRHRKNHHNCVSESYWIHAFKEHGFTLDQTASDEIRVASTMNREFVRNTGKVFVR